MFVCLSVCLSVALQVSHFWRSNKILVESLSTCIFKMIFFCNTKIAVSWSKTSSNIFWGFYRLVRLSLHPPLPCTLVKRFSVFRMQDFLSWCYLWTQKKIFFNNHLSCSLSPVLAGKSHFKTRTWHIVPVLKFSFDRDNGKTPPPWKYKAIGIGTMDPGPLLSQQNNTLSSSRSNCKPFFLV